MAERMVSEKATDVTDKYEQRVRPMIITLKCSHCHGISIKRNERVAYTCVDCGAMWDSIEESGVRFAGGGSFY